MFLKKQNFPVHEILMLITPGASRQGLNLGRVCVPATGKRSDPGGEGEEPWLPRISSRLRLRFAICDLEEIRLVWLLLVL